MQLRTCLVLGAALALAACGSSGSSSSTTTTSPTVVTTTTNNTPATADATVDVPPPDSPNGEYGTGKSAQSSFTPDSITIAVGGTVTWTNRDVTAHTSTSSTGGWNAPLAPGATFSRTFPTAGTFDYRCTIHPSMSGTINVK